MRKNKTCWYELYRKKSTVKSNQQGLETSYKMTKGPELHHAQQSLTHLTQSVAKVHTDMHANKSSHIRKGVPQIKPSHDYYYYWYVP